MSQISDPQHPSMLSEVEVTTHFNYAALNSKLLTLEMQESAKKTAGLHHFFQFATLAKMRSCPSGQGEDTVVSLPLSQLPAMPCPNGC